MSATNNTPKAEDFDFVETTKDSKEKKEKILRPILPKESAKKRIARLEKQIATSGSLDRKSVV